jgi:hypothetical protein
MRRFSGDSAEAWNQWGQDWVARANSLNSGLAQIPDRGRPTSPRRAATSRPGLDVRGDLARHDHIAHDHIAHDHIAHVKKKSLPTDCGFACISQCSACSSASARNSSGRAIRAATSTIVLTAPRPRSLRVPRCPANPGRRRPSTRPTPRSGRPRQHACPASTDARNRLGGLPPRGFQGGLRVGRCRRSRMRTGWVSARERSGKVGCRVGTD